MRAILAMAAGILAVTAAAGGAEEIRTAPSPVATIYPGDPITGASVSMRRFYARTLTRVQAVERMQDVVGKVARRTLAPGRPIPASAIVAPSAVTRGVPAPVMYRDGGLTITGRATPLRSAAVGETVEARNVETGVIVTGRVAAGGVIEVGEP